MEIGILTAPFRGDALDVVVSFAADAGFDCLEIDVRPGCQHLNVVDFDETAFSQAIAQVREAGLAISSFACYLDISAGEEAERAEMQEHLRTAVERAAANDIEIVCCTAGLPPAGMEREETIEQIAAPFFRELTEQAGEKGVKLALENWFATNIEHLGQWDLMFEQVPAENFGLNFDPSHLLWQEIDYLYAVEKFADRIFHSHAKDTEVLAHKKAYLGSQSGRGWWRYVIPGYGEINWGVYIARLKDNGFDGVLSIEHEDRALGREEGFLKALEHLSQFA